MSTENALDIIDRVTVSADEMLPEVSVEEVGMALDYCEHLKRRLREAEEKLHEAAKGWLLVNGGTIPVGQMIYALSEKKKVKCRNVRVAVQALFEATGGDEEAFCEALSVNAIKVGAARKVLGSTFDAHFETTVETDLEKKPVKELVSFNPRFIK